MSNTGIREQFPPLSTTTAVRHCMQIYTFFQLTVWGCVTVILNVFGEAKFIGPHGIYIYRFFVK